MNMKIDKTIYAIVYDYSNHRLLIRHAGEINGSNSWEDTFNFKYECDVDTYREFLLYAISSPIGDAAFSKIAIPDYDIYLRNTDVVNIDLESTFLNINVIIYEFPKPTNDIKPTMNSVEAYELLSIARRTYKRLPISMCLPVQEKNRKLTAWDIQDSYRMKSKYSTDSFTYTAISDDVK